LSSKTKHLAPPAADGFDAGAGADDDDFGPEAGNLVLFEQSERNDDDAIARAGLVGGGAVDRHLARVLRLLDQIGRKPFPVRDVVDVDFLVGNHVGRPQEPGIDPQAALVIQLRFRNDGVLDFRFD